jgi:hypothetical protein
LVRVWHHVKVEPEVTFTDLMKPVTTRHEDVDKNVRKVKVQSGHTVHTWLGRCTWSTSSPRWVVVKVQNPWTTCAKVLRIMRRTLWCRVTSTYAFGGQAAPC